MLSAGRGKTDTTLRHNLTRETLTALAAPLLQPSNPSDPAGGGAGEGAPLAEWTSAFLHPTFDKLRRLYGDGSGGGGDDVPLSLHDPLVVWSLLAPRGGIEAAAARDVRVETVGQWTRGMCVVDARGLAPDHGRADPAAPAVDGAGGVAVERSGGEEAPAPAPALEVSARADDVAGEHVACGQEGEAGWLDGRGNRVFVVDGVTGWEEGFGGEMLKRIYGV
jgi:hypothetical protein